jgi:nitrogen-specific signal transduction histidine kinase
MITVADDGQGISEELLPHLFYRFVKGREGEGVAISRAIVEIVDTGSSRTVFSPDVLEKIGVTYKWEKRKTDIT